MAEEGDPWSAKDLEEAVAVRDPNPPTQAVIATACPYRRHLEPGKTYLYCTCGLSAKQPFCDGSHTGTAFKPLKFSVEKNQSWHLLCGCKRNKPEAGPFCDGSHSNMDW
eukprot:GILJ01011580.1.p1 GENE.GILJ01011580.1~~GILJ01011580.1.p1  ORF type:complete len:124 (+),score=5.71 GILJ01011580.1:47-373(+)